MYKYMVAFVLLTPAIGIYLVERGEFAASIGVNGFPNGAGVAYGSYAAAVALTAWLVAGRSNVSRVELFPAPEGDARFQRFAVNLLAFDTLFLILFLFGFGAINVWTGGIAKGEFRSNLGPLGALPNLMTKFIIPALLAYATLLYKRSSRRRPMKFLLGANIVIVFITGASWGFKSAAFIVLMPALLLLYWRVRTATLVKLGLAFVAGLTLFFQLFDAASEDATGAAEFLFRRVTVLQGDVAWHIWNKYVDGEQFPNYWPTLLAMFGDSTLEIFGLSKGDFYRWMDFHYDYMITYLTGAPPYQIQEGHNVTATPFAEGLIAAGLPGVATMAILAGLLTGGMYRYIAGALRSGRDSHAAIAASYFCFYIFGWLNGGAIVQLFHISLFVGFAATLLTLQLLRRVSAS